MKIKRFDKFNESSASKSAFVSDVQIDNILDRTKGKNLSDLERKRMKMWSEGDDEIKELTYRLSLATQNLNKLGEKIKIEISKIKNPTFSDYEKFKGEFEIYALELNKIANELKNLYGIDPNSTSFEYFVKKQFEKK